MTQLPEKEPWKKLPARLTALATLIAAKNPLHRRAINEALEKIDGIETGRLEKYLEFCETTCGLSADDLSECYLTIVRDALREHIYFQKYKKYRHASFQDVANDVYFNADYMKRYMYGLALTTFFWPNHRAMMHFFERTLPHDKAGKYLEIGPGHGFFFMTAMEKSFYSDFEGVDISKTSVDMTQRILDFYGAGRRYKAAIVCKDFLKAKIAPVSCDAIVMGEVLEHVERPDIFMARIVEISKPGAYIFITTCCNVPAIDHIYLFNNPIDVEKLFTDAGLRVKESLILPVPGQNRERYVMEQPPVNVAYVLEK